MIIKNKVGYLKVVFTLEQKQVHINGNHKSILSNKLKKKTS